MLKRNIIENSGEHLVCFLKAYVKNDYIFHYIKVEVVQGGLALSVIISMQQAVK